MARWPSGRHLSRLTSSSTPAQRKSTTSPVQNHIELPNHSPVVSGSPIRAVQSAARESPLSRPHRRPRSKTSRSCSKSSTAAARQRRGISCRASCRWRGSRSAIRSSRRWTRSRRFCCQAPCLGCWASLGRRLLRRVRLRFGIPWRAVGMDGSSHVVPAYTVGGV